MEHTGASFVFALALGAGVMCQVLARHLHIPSIVLLLAAGVLLGPDGAGWVVPERLGDGLFQIVRLAVAVILFEGGLNLKLSRLRRESVPIRMLVTVGAVITGVGGALAARAFMDWDWSLAALFGALVTVTGPTVIKPLLRISRLRPRIATVLEAEGVLIDPIGAILAAVTLEVILQASVDPLLGGLLQRLAFGAVAGLGFGFALAALLRLPRVIPDGFANIATLGLVLLLFELCDLYWPETGILAVTVAGVVVGNASGNRVGDELGEFEELLTVALIALLFVLLAADVRLASVIGLGWRGIATVAALVLLVRPLNVLLSTWGSELDTKERIFLSWVAPRGVVAAAIASLFAAVLQAEGFEGGREFRALVFLTIGVTVVLQGGTAPLLARALGLRMPARDSYVILGAEELAFALADVLRAANRPVIFVDSNPNHCRAASERGFPAVYGNALAFVTLARARLERARAVLGITPNDEVNSLFAREATDDFGVDRTYVARSRDQSSVRERILEKQGSHALFDGPTDVLRWNVRFRHQLGEVARFRFVGLAEGKTEGGSDDGYILLTRRRADEVVPMHMGLALREGDEADVAIFVSERDEVIEKLRDAGWEPISEELIPAEGDSSAA
jgi:NhaP-type Na+/H+ or K+/H+ antiporter